MQTYAEICKVETCGKVPKERKNVVFCRYKMIRWRDGTSYDQKTGRKHEIIANTISDAKMEENALMSLLIKGHSLLFL